jgi:hypothetical protein
LKKAGNAQNEIQTMEGGSNGSDGIQKDGHSIAEFFVKAFFDQMSVF